MIPRSTRHPAADRGSPYDTIPTLITNNPAVIAGWQRGRPWLEEHPTTRTAHGTFVLSPEVLLDLPTPATVDAGTRAQWLYRTTTYGFDTRLSARDPITVHVNARGLATLVDGKYRVMAAWDANMPSVPFVVEYYGGSELLATAWQPRTYKRFDMTPFDPRQLPGLVAWYAADRITGLKDGDLVTTWVDLSGKGNDATASSKPTYKVSLQNGLPIVRFDGVSNVLTTAGPVTTAAQETLVIAYRWVVRTSTPFWYNGGFPNGMYLGAVGGGRDITTPGRVNVQSVNATTTVFEVWDGSYDGTNLQLFVNGLLDVSGASAAMATPTATQLGGDATLGFSRVDVGEALAFSRALLPSERGQLDGYLRTKWGTP